MSNVHMQYPGPKPSPLTLPFWSASANHRLIVQHCTGCGAHIFYPRQICPHCWSSELEWTEVSGHATVACFVGAYKPAHPAFFADVPYVIALVDLAEGPRMLTNIIDATPDDELIGQKVVVTYLERGGTILPVFRLANPE